MLVANPMMEFQLLYPPFAATMLVDWSRISTMSTIAGHATSTKNQAHVGIWFNTEDKAAYSIGINERNSE